VLSLEFSGACVHKVKDAGNPQKMLHFLAKDRSSTAISLGSRSNRLVASQRAAWDEGLPVGGLSDLPRRFFRGKTPLDVDGIPT
jgi:hypothetical protein